MVILSFVNTDMSYMRINVFLVASLSFPAFAFSPSHAQTSSADSAREWQKNCVSKNLYSRGERREGVSRYGISFLIPKDFDFDYNAYDFGEGYNNDRISLAPIPDLVHIRCMRIGSQLHGIRIHGGGVPGYSIYEKNASHFDVSRDKFVDAIVIFGKKWPVYDNGYSFWVSIVNPANKKRLVLEGSDVREEQFLEFARSILVAK